MIIFFKNCNYSYFYNDKQCFVALNKFSFLKSGCFNDITCDDNYYNSLCEAQMITLSCINLNYNYIFHCKKKKAIKRIMKSS